METRIASKSQQVTISPDLPIAIIGERINPTGKKRLAASLGEKDMSRVQRLAKSQEQGGAAILDVNVGAAGVDEVELLPLAVAAVGQVSGLPLCLDSANADALRAALAVYEGKALINSVNGETKSMDRVLPLVKEYGAAVIGLTMDDDGIPMDAQKRIDIAKKIIDRAVAIGIPQEDVIIDCLALTVSADCTAATVTMGAIAGVREQLGQNMSLGASNISFGLPNRDDVNDVFLSMALKLGVNAPIVNPRNAQKTVLIADLLLGHDDFGMTFVTYCRKQAATQN